MKLAIVLIICAAVVLVVGIVAAAWITGKAFKDDE